MARAKLKRKQSLMRHSDPLTNALLVFPLFLLYEVGVLAIPSVHNGADLITSEMLHLLHGNIQAYLVLNGALALGFVLLCLILRRNNSFNWRLFLPVVLESTIYALTMGSLICFVMIDFLHVDPKMWIHPLLSTAPEQQPLFAKLVLAVGAGVHEELMFRLVMVGGGIWVLTKLGSPRWFAVLVAFAVSSVLFSAAHHIIGGEPWRLGAFTYRVLCGLFFATLFETRGLAVAVYTHALYDIYVLIVRG